jgi:signal transduction histidine kinase
LYTVYLLLRSYKTAEDVNKKGQILYIIFAVIFGFGGGLSNFPLWWGINIPPYGNFLAAAFPFLFGYSILKYKLFNAKTIATEILVFFIAVILLVEATLSASILEAVLKTGIFIVVSIFGYLLIRSVYREVAQREKIELLAKDLENANERLRELDKQKTEFISFATHQLRAPLTAMKGYASLIIEGDMGEVPAKVNEAVGRMFESAKTMTTVVDDYLNVSRIELGSMKYNFEPLDMNVLVNEVAGELKPNIMKSGLKFDYKVVGEGPWAVSADPDKWKQVIANIIDNSVKYTPRGSLSVKLERVPNADGTIPVRLSVTDTGIGIAPGVMPKLFQKFSRADNANKQNIHGTGLGLFIVREIVNAHHGRVWAESEGEGKGSKFIVELPAT